MKYIEYPTLQEAQTRENEIFQLGINQNLFSGEKFADIVEFNSKFYLPYIHKFSQLYTASEINSATEILFTREQELALSETQRRAKMRQAIAYLESENITTEQRDAIGQAISLYINLYYLGTDENNVMLLLLNNPQFVSQFNFLTQNQIDQLKIIFQ